MSQEGDGEPDEHAHDPSAPPAHRPDSRHRYGSPDKLDPVPLVRGRHNGHILPPRHQGSPDFHELSLGRFSSRDIRIRQKTQEMPTLTGGTVLERSPEARPGET